MKKGVSSIVHTYLRLFSHIRIFAFHYCITWGKALIVANYIMMMAGVMELNFIFSIWPEATRIQCGSECGCRNFIWFLS